MDREVFIVYRVIVCCEDEGYFKLNVFIIFNVCLSDENDNKLIFN